MVCCSENLKNLSKTEQTVDIHYIKFERYLVITAQVSVCVHTDLEKVDLHTLIKMISVFKALVLSRQANAGSRVQKRVVYCLTTLSAAKILQHRK
jgi:hypothetical protein